MSTKRIIFFFFLLITQNNLFSQEQFDLRYRYNGNYEFTMIGDTFNSRNNNGNSSDCDRLNLDADDSSTAELLLEDGEMIHRAFLYWSATGSNPDHSVTLNGQNVTSEVTYQLSADGYDFFGNRADITDLVSTIGSGSYTLTDLEIDRNPVNDKCTGSYGGWSILVVLEHPDFELNSIFIYDGFLDQPNPTLSNIIRLDLDGLLVPETENGELGILSWEGDAALRQGDEEVILFNNHSLFTPPLNPEFNVFNETNSFTGENRIYNMDLDWFSVSDYLTEGDQFATVEVFSNRDVTIMHSIPLSINTILADPSVVIETAEYFCNESRVFISLNVQNINATDAFPAGSPIHVYFNEIDDSPDHTIITDEELPREGSFSFEFDLPITNDITQIIATINLDEGEPIVLEIDPSNNISFYDIETPALPNIPINVPFQCENEEGNAIFNINDIISLFQDEYDFIHLGIYETESDADNDENELSGDYIVTTHETPLFSRQENLNNGCVGVVPFSLFLEENPMVENIIQQFCIVDEPIEIDLQSLQPNITSLDGVFFQYFDSQEDAEFGEVQNEIETLIEVSDRVIFVRTTFNETNCYSVSTLEIQVFQTPITNPDISFEICTVPDEINPPVNLNGYSDLLVQNLQDSFSLSFFTSLEEAQANNNAITNANNFIIDEQQMVIYYRVENQENEDCYMIDNFMIRKALIDQDLQISNCKQNNQASFLIPEIVSNLEDQFGYEISPTFYLSESDLNNEINPWEGEIFLEESTEMFFAYSFSEDDSECFSVTQVTLLVEENELREELIGICIDGETILPDGSIVQEPGDYLVTVLDHDAGCDVDYSVSVLPYQFSFPTAITADANGLNDLFYPLISNYCNYEFESYHLVIYNRWGEVVFETNDHTVPWDGRSFNVFQAGIFLWQANYVIGGQDFSQNGLVHLFL